MELIYAILYNIVNILGTVIILCGIIVGIVYLIVGGYLDNYTWYKNIKRNLQNHINSKVTDNPILKMITGSLFSSNKGSEIEPVKNGKSLTFTTMYDGVTYRIILPFDETMARKNKGKKVYVRNPDNTLSDITTVPGTSYYISPETLSAKEIIVKGLDDSIISKFSNDQIVKI